MAVSRAAARRAGAFESALEAQLALDDVLSGDAGYIAAPVALESFLTRYEECEASACRRPRRLLAPQPVAPTPIVAAEPIVPVAVPPPPAPAPFRVAPVSVSSGSTCCASSREHL